MPEMEENMNKVILMGRFVRNAEVRYPSGENSTAVARFTLAVNRRFQGGENEQTADFINCTAFGKTAEVVEKYTCQGTKVVIEGHIQTGSYTNKDGNKVYTTQVIIENLEFAEKKAGTEENGGAEQGDVDADGFMNIPDGDEELPFK